MFPFSSDKPKSFVENFSENSNLDDSGISLPVFHSRANLKLHNISVTFKMVKEIIINFDLSKASNPLCSRPVSLLSVVRKVFEKLVNNRIVDHQKKCALSSNFQYSFTSSRSTVDLLTVVSDRSARAFHRPGATKAVALDKSKTFGRVRHAGLLHKLKSYRNSG